MPRRRPQIRHPSAVQASARLIASSRWDAGNLNALLYADGIHDSLYRTAGRDITSLTKTTTDTATLRVPAMREEKTEAPAPA